MIVLETFYEEQSALLEQIASGAPLRAVLEGIVRLIERHSEGMLCSILLLDAERRTLHEGAAPSLPLEWRRAIEGAAIGPNEGSCGAAAFRGERVVVEDIATHPFWASYREIPLRHGLRSCWSTPIVSPQKEVLGTFAMYRRTARGPTEQEAEWVVRATHLAALAIVHDRAERSLRRSEARARQLARLHAVSSAVNEAIVRVREPRELLSVACRIAVEKGLAQLAWIGAYDEADGAIEPLASFGEGREHASGIRLSPEDARAGKGPVARALLEGAPALADDVATDEGFHRKEEALRRGLRSCAVFPLRLGERRRGVLAIYGDRAGFFQEEEVRVLGALASDISFAIESAEGEVERRRLQEQLRQAQKMEAIGLLAGGVAHDFNNLLTVILSVTSLAQSKLAPQDPLRVEVGEIARAAARAGELTRQLLAFSRRQVLQPRVIDLHRVASGLEDMLKRVLGADVELAIRRSPSSGNVLADPGQVEQVIVNLAVNARDAMPRGGRITIDTGEMALDEAAAARASLAAGRYVTLTVADTGQGMDAATLSRIFEPFFTTKGQGKGTGLGLSTVWGIVKQSGGHIFVESDPGAGTAFKVLLPRAEGPLEALPDAASALAPPRGSETVLLVEDDEQVRNVLRAILSSDGYRVIDAASGAEAIALCERDRRRIDLLVTDVVMPRMGGPELAERLGPSRPEMRVLFISGYAEEAVARKGVLKPGSAFLEKPITPAALERKVREVLDAPAAR